MSWTDAEKLIAIEARIDEWWDTPELMKLGPLTDDVIRDVRRILSGVERERDNRFEVGDRVMLRTDGQHADMLGTVVQIDRGSGDLSLALDAFGLDRHIWVYPTEVYPWPSTDSDGSGENSYTRRAKAARVAAQVRCSCPVDANGEREQEFVGRIPASGGPWRSWCPVIDPGCPIHGDQRDEREEP